MNSKTHTTLGDLITVFFDEYMELYGDEELAAVAAAATLNDLISEQVYIRLEREDEAAA